MIRSRLTPTLLVIAAMILAASGFVAWRAIHRQRLFYTDGEAIHQSIRHVNPRDILWRPPIALSPNINTADQERRVAISADEQSMYFTRQRPGQDRDIVVAQRLRSELGDSRVDDLNHESWRSTPGASQAARSHAALLWQWGDPLPVREINSLSDDQDPAISRDGSLLVFSSNRPGGLGGFDLWVSHRGVNGWEQPVNLGPAVNSEFDEITPAFNPDGSQLYFASNRSVGNVETSSRRGDQNVKTSQSDLYVATILNGEPQNARAIPELNSDSDDAGPAFSPGGDFLYFASKRAGGFGGADLYRSRVLDGKFLTPVNLGPDVNTAGDEFDPSLCMGGFGLFFSSDRISDDDAIGPLSGSNLFFTTSREVFVRADEAAIDWARIREFLGPALLLALIVAFLVTLLIAMLRGVRSRRLSLLARCLLVSLIAHLMLLLLFTFWHVTVTIAANMDRGGTRVALTSHAAKDELHLQVRGEFTSEKVAATFAEVAAAHPDIAPTSSQEMTELAAEQASQPPAEAMPVRAQVADAAVTSQAFVPMVRADVPRDSIAVAVQSRMQESQSSQKEPILTAAMPNVESTKPAIQSEHIPAIKAAQDDAVAIMPASHDATGWHESPTEIANAVKVAESIPPANVNVATPIASPPTPHDATAVKVEVANLPTAPQQKASEAEERQLAIATPLIESARQQTTPAPIAAEVPASRFTPAKVDSIAEAKPLSIAVTAAEAPARLADSNQAAEITPAPTVPPIQLAGQSPALPTDFANVVTAYEAQGPSRPEIVASNAESNRHETPSLAVKTVEITSPVFAPQSAKIEPTALAMRSPVVDAPAPTSDVQVGFAQPTLAIVPVEIAAQLPVELPADARSGEPVNETFERAPDAKFASIAKASPALHAAVSAAQTNRATLGPEAAGDNPAEVARSEPIDLALAAATSEIPDDASIPSIVSKTATDLPLPADVATAVPTEMAPPSEQFTQRAPEFREQIVKRMGGSEATEKAVALSLAWLAKHQSPGGRWAAKDFDDRCGGCGGEAKFDTDVATTGLALLCFLAADHTHTKPGPYRQNVERGINWLIAHQKRDGDLRHGETMYSHGIASIALAEAFAMTRDERLREPVLLATQFIIEARNRPVGGWRYEPGQAGDTSVLGWQVMALCSARRAGVEVPAEMFAMSSRWLDSVSTEAQRGLYAYQPGQRHSTSMTAEAMFVQELIGLKPDEPRMQASSKYILENMPRWRGDASTYYWYYATLALFQQQGPAWETWNKAITEQLLAHQRTDGPAAGSWDVKDNWSRIGGRVYQTALCTLCLEVYYRYLPMYADVK